MLPLRLYGLVRAAEFTQAAVIPRPLLEIEDRQVVMAIRFLTSAGDSDRCCDRHIRGRLLRHCRDWLDCFCGPPATPRVTGRLLGSGFETLETQCKTITVGMIFNAIRQMN